MRPIRTCVYDEYRGRSWLRGGVRAVPHGILGQSKGCPYRAGRLRPRPEEFPLHILFVCTGNICRSPMAERYAAAYGAQLQIPDLRTSSAGTRAVVGHPVHKYAAATIEKLGGRASNFAARQFTPRIAADADLVLTMTKVQRDTVLELAPRLLHKTFTLTEAARLVTESHAEDVSELAALRSHVAVHELPDIPDPIGQTPEVFAAVGSQLASLLPPILELCRLRPARP